MSKVMGILGVATKVMSFIVVTVIAIVSLATAYIMFAPDEFPKPFRLVYDYSGAPMALAAEPTVEPTPEPHVYRPGEGVMVDMATKIINLADPSGRKYIRLTMVLEFAPVLPHAEEVEGEEPKSSGGHGGGEAETLTVEDQLLAQITTLTPVMDDTVITLLSTKTYEQLYTAEGKEALRQELMHKLAEKMPDYQLISVYFTEFVVQ